METKSEGHFLATFLNLIETHMLVVDPHHRKPEGEYHRLTCHGVYQSLGDTGRIIGLKDDMFDGDDDEDDEKWRHRIRHLMRHISTGSCSRLVLDG